MLHRSLGEYLAAILGIPMKPNAFEKLVRSPADTIHLVDGPLVLQEILRFFQGAGFQIVVGIAGETVGGQFVRRMFHTEDQAVPVEVVARDGQARLPDATLVVLVARVDALVPLEAVVKSA